jgi:hypothetical protein
MGLAVLCLAAAAGAQELPRPEEPHLRAGNLRFGADLSLTGNSFSNGTSSYSLTAGLPLQYFVADGLAVGGAVDWTTSGSTVNGVSRTATVVAIGAEVGWYFWRHDRWAAFLQPEVFVNLRAPDLPTTFTVAGASSLEWFLSPSVSVGPGLLFAHEFGTGPIADADLYRFFVEVLIYL